MLFSTACEGISRYGKILCLGKIVCFKSKDPRGLCESIWRMRWGEAQQAQKLTYPSATFRDQLSFKSNQQAFYECLFRVKDFMRIPFCFFLPEALRSIGCPLTCFFFYSLRTITCPSAVCSPGEVSLYFRRGEPQLSIRGYLENKLAFG